MTEPIAIEEEGEEGGGGGTSGCVQEIEPAAAAKARVSRKEKRKAAKKEKRKQMRKELAEKARVEEEARINDPEEQLRIQLEEQRENERLERERRKFEESERKFLEELARKRAEEEEYEQRRMALEEETKRNQAKNENESNENDDWEYVEEGPPEIIWQGNEIIVKKNRVKVKKKDADQQTKKEDPDRPTSNPLPPQSEAFDDYKNASVVSAQQLLENVAQQIPNFGTEQDKAHCPFHIKTGACRFGLRCSRVHFYPDKSCTLLAKNMYNGPGLAWEQDEGLEYTDEEVERCYEEFYEDVHTEFLKFGEIINFKVCRNGSFHLRGNVYVHYRSLDSAVLAFHSINGRYFAGKQVNFEFVGVTRWKVAICGEYMKSRLKTCSRGTTCNFIHCFRNPGGDYEWADWDKPPPKFWVKKMAALFGYSDESWYDKQMEQETLGQLRYSSKMLTADRDRYHSRGSRSRERDYLNECARRSRYEKHDGRKSTHQQRHTSDGRKQLKSLDENNREEERDSKNNQHGKNRTSDTDSDGDWLDWDRNGDRQRDSTRKSSRHQIKMAEFRDYRSGSKSRTLESGSDGDLSDSYRDRDTDRHRCRTRKSSQHPNKASEIQDDFGDSKNKTCSADSRGDELDENRDRGRHLRDRRKSSRHRNKVSVSPYGYCDDRSRTNDSGSLDSRYDYEENTNRVEFENDFPEKQKRSKGAFTGDVESLSPDRYNGRSESHDSGYYPDEDVDKRGRWEPDKIVPEKNHKSRRKKFGGDDHKQQTVKSESHKRISDKLQESEVNNEMHRKKRRSHGDNRQDKKNHS